jgi:transcriptional regulatory protein GAL4
VAIILLTGSQGNYLQKRDRPNTGYNMIGIAFRMALGLGLHREIPDLDNEHNTLNKELRRRVWWILYMVDSGFSITMGRPTTASDAFIDARFPLNIDDSVTSLRYVFIYLAKLTETST